MERTPLKPETILDFDGREYKVISLMSDKGGSCLVYKAERLPSKSQPKNVKLQKAVIKEFYPQTLSQYIARDGEGLRNTEKDRFDAKKKQFINGVAEQVAFYGDDSNHKMDGTPEAYDDINGTAYSVLDLTNGAVLRDIDRSTLSACEIAQIMVSLCNAVKKLHLKDKLYLDVKHDNVFLFEWEQSESRRVALFDFDTVVEKDNLPDVGYRSKGWSPDEQNDWNKEEISEATDIYAIGELFYWLLTGEDCFDALSTKALQGFIGLENCTALRGKNAATKKAKEILIAVFGNGEKIKDLGRFVDMFNDMDELAGEHTPFADIINKTSKELKEAIIYGGISPRSVTDRFTNDRIVTHILFIAANVSVQNEVFSSLNRVNNILRDSGNRNEFDIVACNNNEKKEIRRKFAEISPNLVVFIGNLSKNESICFDNAFMKDLLLNCQAIDCFVFFNCGDKNQIELFRQYSDCVITIDGRIEMQAYNEFFEIFFKSIFAKRKYSEAFSSALLTIAESVTFENIPHMYLPTPMKKEAKEINEKVQSWFNNQNRNNPHLMNVVSLKSNFIETNLLYNDVNSEYLSVLQSLLPESSDFNPTMTEFLFLISSGNDKLLNFPRVFWIHGKAGTGKTYGLLNSWQKLVSMGKNAIYIPLNMLSTTMSIETFLDKKVFTGNTKNTWREVLSLDSANEFAPLILILDGFNEINATSKNYEQETIMHEIEMLASDLNVVICVSSRRVDNLTLISEKNSEKLYIKPLGETEIRNYIDNQCITAKITLNEKLIELFETPLMLALYCESSEYYNGQQHKAFPCVEYILGEPSESTIIWNYLQCMVSKAFESKEASMSPEQRFGYIVLIRYIAPYIGYYMQSNNCFRLPMKVVNKRGILAGKNKEKEGVKSFDVLFDEAVSYYKTIKDSDEVTLLMRESNVLNHSVIDVQFLRNIAVNDLALFVKNDDVFVLFHQSIRDCLSAIHYINDIKFCVQGEFPKYWANINIKRESVLIQHIAELDEKLEPMIPYRNTNLLWESLRQASPIYRETKDGDVRENLNIQAYNESFSYNLISNCINIYKQAYDSNLSILDFSGIDLSHTPMNEFIFFNDKSVAKLGNCAIGSETFFINGHIADERILSVAFKNKTLLSRSDKSLRVWNNDTGKCIDVLFYTDEENNEVPFMDVNFDKNTFKCVYANGKVIYEHDFSKNATSLFTVCEDTILSVSYSPNGEMIICTDVKNNVFLFDVATKELTFKMENCDESDVSVYLHCDCTNNYIPYICTNDNSVHIIDINSGNDIPLQNSKYDKSAEIICVKFSESVNLCAVSAKNNLTVYDLSNFSICFSEKINDDYGVVTDIVFCDNGAYLACCAENQKMFIYETEKILKDGTGNPDEICGNGLDCFGVFLSLSFCENKKTLFIGDDYGKIHRIKNDDKNTFLCCFDGCPPSVRNFDVNSTETFVVGAYNDGTIKKWNLMNGVFVSDYPTTENYGSANCVRYSNKNDYIIVGFSNGKISFWDSETTGFLFELDNVDIVSDIVITDDDNYLLCACQNGSIHIWDIDKKKEIYVHTTAHSNIINAFLLHECPQYRHLISVSNDGYALMWDLDISSNKPLCLYKEIKKSDKHICGLALFNDKVKPVKFAVLSDDGHLTEFTMENGTQINDFELKITEETQVFGFENYWGNNSSYAIGYNSNGKMLAISYSSRSEGSAGIQIIDVEKQTFLPPVPFYKFEQYKDYIFRIEYLKNDSIVFCSRKGDIVVIDSSVYQPIFEPMLLEDGFSDKLKGCDLSQIIDINGITEHFFGSNKNNTKNAPTIDLESEIAYVVSKLLDGGAVLNPFNYVRKDKDIDDWAYSVVSAYAKNNPVFIPQRYITLFLTSQAQYLFYEAPPDEQNIYMLEELFRAAEFRASDPNFQSDLDRLFKLLEDKNSNHISLRNYKKFKKINVNMKKSVVTICQRIFNPTIFSSNDILSHAKTLDDLPRIALSFISNSKTTGFLKATEDEEMQFASEVDLLIIVFTYMLTEVDMTKRTIEKAKSVIHDIDKLIGELQNKYPNHLAVLSYNDFRKDVNDATFQQTTESLISRFHSLYLFYNEFK